MMHSPFQSKRKNATPVEVIAVGDLSIHLLRRGFIVPIEDYETDALQKREAEASAIYLDAMANCKREKGLTSKQVDELFSPTKTADGAEVEGADIRDYLSPQQVTRIVELQSLSKEDIRQVVTLMIRERLVYPVVAKTTAKAKATNLPEIEPLRFNLAAGNRLLFGETIVEVADEAGYDDETVSVKGLPRQINEGEVGYLLDMKGAIKVGCPDWTIEHTKALIDDALQGAAIYAFYKRELTGNQPPKGGADDLGNSMNTSIDSTNISSESQRIGPRSIGESRATESPTNDLTPTTLEASPVG